MCVKGQEHVQKERKAMSQRIIALTIIMGTKFVIEGSRKTGSLEYPPFYLQIELLKISPLSLTS